MGQKVWKFWLPMVLLLAVLGCKAKDDVEEIVSGAVTLLVDADAGGVVEADAGRLEGATVDIPAGALAGDTSISIEVGQNVAVEDFTRVGPTVDFGPDGTEFSTDVSISVPFDADTIPDGATTDDLVMYTKSGTDDPVLVDGATVSGGVMTAEVSHFSRFWVAVLTPSSGGGTISIATVFPASGPPEGGTAIALTGTGFSAGTTTVTVGGVAATNVVVNSDISLVFLTPAGTAGAAVDVVVSNDNGSATAEDGFMYNANAAHTVTSVSPNHGDAGDTVTIHGTGFTNPGAVSVFFESAAATNVVVVSDTEITVTVPAAPAQYFGTVIVTIDTDPIALALAFTYD